MIEKQKPLSWYLANVDMDTLMPCMNERGVLLHASEFLEINQIQTDVVNEGKNFQFLTLNN